MRTVRERAGRVRQGAFVSRRWGRRPLLGQGGAASWGECRGRARWGRSWRDDTFNNNNNNKKRCEATMRKVILQKPSEEEAVRDGERRRS